jgi:hydrogenase maturation protease
MRAENGRGPTDGRAMNGKSRGVVLGLGNVLNRDEGLGIFCLDLLRSRLPDCGGVEFLDGGVLGMALLPVVEACGHLLLLDAVDAGRPPGTVVELSREEIPRLARLKLSWHQLGFQEVLEFAAVRGNLPERLHLVGVQPFDIVSGYRLSPAIEEVLPKIADRAVEILKEWGLA